MGILISAHFFPSVKKSTVFCGIGADNARMFPFPREMMIFPVIFRGVVGNFDGCNKLWLPGARNHYV